MKTNNRLFRAARESAQSNPHDVSDQDVYALLAITDQYQSVADATSTATHPVQLDVAEQNLDDIGVQAEIEPGPEPLVAAGESFHERKSAVRTRAVESLRVSRQALRIANEGIIDKIKAMLGSVSGKLGVTQELLTKTISRLESADEVQLDSKSIEGYFAFTETNDVRALRSTVWDHCNPAVMISEIALGFATGKLDMRAETKAFQGYFKPLEVYEIDDNGSFMTGAFSGLGNHSTHFGFFHVPNKRTGQLDWYVTFSSTSKPNPRYKDRVLKMKGPDAAKALRDSLDFFNTFKDLIPKISSESKRWEGKLADQMGRGHDTVTRVVMLSQCLTMIQTALSATSAVCKNLK